MILTDPCSPLVFHIFAPSFLILQHNPTSLLDFNCEQPRLYTGRSEDLVHILESFDSVVSLLNPENGLWFFFVMCCKPGDGY